MNLKLKNIIAAFSLLAVMAGCKEEETQLEVSVEFRQDSYEMTIGEEALDLAAEMTIKNSSSAPEFKSSVESVATVNAEGLVTAVAVGETVITATVEGKSASCTVKVSELTAKSITLSSASTTLVAGAAETVTATWEPEGYDPANLEWSCQSNPEGIATFTKIDDANYYVTFNEYQKDGKAVITVKDKLSETAATHTLSVTQTVERINLNETLLFKNVGDDPVQLVATCFDLEGNVVEGYDNLEWSASKEEGIVSVEVVEVTQDGLVTFKNKGTCTVTVANRSNRAVSASCNITVSAAAVKVESISLNPSSANIKVGEKFTISALVLPEDAEDKTVTFISNNNGIATVTPAGEVEGIAEGEAEITVAATNGVSAVCKVTVSNEESGETPDAPAVQEIIKLETENKESELPQLKSVKIIPYYEPAGSAPKTSSWKSSDESLATVDENGVVTAVAPYIDEEEETWVTITHYADEKTASIALQIVRARPEVVRFTAEPEGNILYIGETFQYSAIVEPDLANQKIIWQCFDADGGSILAGIDFDTGEFKTGGSTRIGVGKYTIRAKAAADESIAAYSEVEVLPIEIENATLNYTEVELNVGAFINLEVTFEPHNATFKDVVWTSSDESIATVNNGLVTATGAGNAIITATLSNGIELTCSVNVVENASGPKVGDFYYSDGTWSTELDSSKTPVGIVFSIDNVTLHDKTLAASHPECTHGIVVSIKETAPVKWQGWRSDVNEWAVNNGYMPLTGVECPSGTSDFYLTDNGKKLCGYNNTAAIKAYMQTTEYAGGGDDVKISLFDNEADMPEVAGTSGWYIPSVAELNAIAAETTLIQEKIELAGGDKFATGYEVAHWSSTQGKNIDTAVCVRLDNGAVTYNRQKGKSQNVRFVFAF